MPYDTIADVPDSVPVEHRAQWREVWNSAYGAAKKDGKDDRDAESSAFAQANGVIKKAEMTDLPAVTLSEVQGDLVRTPICYAGQKFKKGGQEFTITSKDLRQMEHTLSKREVMMDYEHWSARQDAPPGYAKASGWIKKPAGIETLSNGKETLFGWTRFTAPMLTAIFKNEYRYVSAEPHWDEKDEHGKNIGTVLAAAAMTNRPFQKDLPPIEISADAYPKLLEAVAMSEFQVMVDTIAVHIPAIINDTKEKTMADEMMKKLKFKKMKDGPHKGKVGIFADDAMVGMCDKAEMKAYMDDEPDEDDMDLEKKAAKMKEQRLSEERGRDAICLKELSEAKPSEMEDMIDKFSEGNEISLAGMRRAQKIDRLLRDAAAKGKFKPTQRKALFSMAIWDFETVAALLAEQPVVVDTKNYGIEGRNDHVGGDATKELMEATYAYMTEQGMVDAKGKPDMSQLAAGMRAFTMTEAGERLYENKNKQVMNKDYSLSMGD